MQRKPKRKSKKKLRIPIIASVLRKIAPRIGVKVDIEPEWGVVGKLTYPDGKVRFFRYSTIDINTVGASDISKDKDYAKHFMAKAGFNVIAGKAFCSKSWAKAIGSNDTEQSACKFATKLGFPVIVKPNSMSQGSGVTKVHTKTEFIKAFRAVSKADRMVLVEKFIVGRDYRVVVLDKKVISAYERIPLFVTGDGRSTIFELLHKKQKEFDKIGRDTCIKFDDPRTRAKLARAGMKLQTRLIEGQNVTLLDNANLSTGGDSVDVTEILHADIAKLAISITKEMGLRLCGVDLMLSAGAAVSLKKQKHWVIETNAAPGLDHYATIGKKQEKIVEDLYLEVLKAMGK